MTIQSDSCRVAEIRNRIAAFRRLVAALVEAETSLGSTSPERQGNQRFCLASCDHLEFLCDTVGYLPLFRQRLDNSLEVASVTASWVKDDAVRLGICVAEAVDAFARNGRLSTDLFERLMDTPALAPFAMRLLGMTLGQAA